MGACAAIKPNGARCQARAMRGSQWCYVHDPELAQERRRNNRKGGLSGGRGRAKDSEMAALKREAARLYERVLEGEVAPSVGAVGVQTLNLRARLWESERRAALAESEVVTQEQMAEDVQRVAGIITRHVKDKVVLDAIREDLKLADEARRQAP